MRSALLCLCLAAALVPAARAQDHDDHAAANAAVAPADAKIVASAVRAAPAKVTQGAAIVAMDSDGSMRTVREGANGFTCMADNPHTPGPDPMCADANAMDWLMAYIDKKQPPKGRIGFIYMLEGGTDASNTDPYAKGPSGDNDWIRTGPHVMIVGADDDFYAGYPSGPDPDTDAPFVMWAGTPYRHLMAPVR